MCMCIPYLLDQTPLSNCHRTSGHAEQNSRRSRILATANIQVAHAHREQTSCLKWQYQMSIHDIHTREPAVQRSSAFFEAWRAIIM